jgi:Flp pilus assembly protein TadG
MLNRLKRRGANALEFALIAPVMVLITGLTVDYGWYFTNDMTAIAVLRAQARTDAALSSTNAVCATMETNVQTALAAAGYGTIATSQITVQIANANSSQYYVTIHANVPYTRLWVPSAMMPANLKPYASQRMESQSVTACSI